jgi:hypothetical protein
MPLRLFKALLAQMANWNALMKQLAASCPMEGMVAVLILKLFVVKTGTVATMHRLAVSHLVVVFTLMQGLR